MHLSSILSPACWCWVFTVCAACAGPQAAQRAPSLAFVSNTALVALVTPDSSVLDSYHLTSAVWVQNQPLLVNRDFDFATALGLEDVGPAIAAGKRVEGNKSVAGALERMPPLDLSGKLRRAIDDCDEVCRAYWTGIADARMHVAIYGLLYGGTRTGASTRLVTVLELYPAALLSGGSPSRTPLEPERFMDVAQPLALDGTEGWLDSDGTKVVDALGTGVRELVSVAAEYDRQARERVDAPSSSSSDAAARAPVTKTCPIGDGEAPEGVRIGAWRGRDVLKLTDVVTTVVVCAVTAKKT